MDLHFYLNFNSIFYFLSYRFLGRVEAKGGQEAAV